MIIFIKLVYLSSVISLSHLSEITELKYIKLDKNYHFGKKISNGT